MNTNIVKMKATRILFYGLLCSITFVGCEKEHLDKVDDVCTKMDDIEFMRYCYDNFDVNHDGKVSMEEANAVKEIDLDEGVSSLKGLEYFPNIEYLNCWGGYTSLDLSKNTKLIEVVCSESALTNLNVSKNASLVELHCGDTNLKSLDLSGCPNLEDLDCEGNYDLTSLDLSKNAKLIYLTCYSCNLTSIDVTKCINLSYIHCAHNQLSSLDVSFCPKLRELDCSNNRIKTLNLSNCVELESLYCNSNLLTSLDVSNCLELYSLQCYDNPYLEVIWVSSGQSIPYLKYDEWITTIKTKK